MLKQERRPAYKLSKAERKAVIMMILPALAEAVLSHTFALVDSAMLGNAPDATTSVASVGLTASLVGLIANMINAFTVGTTATVAWFLGRRNPEGAKSTARQTLAISAVFGLLLSLISTLGAETVVRFFGATDEDVIRGATEYFFIIGIGFFFQFMTTNIGAALRGAKITKYTMWYNLAANAANVGMNYVLIFGKLGFEPMGLRGAAIATTLSKVLSFAIALTVICVKKNPVQISLKKSFLPQAKILRRVISISVTAMLEQLILQGGNVLFTKIISGIPKVDFSAYNVAANVTGFVWNVSGSCAIASTTYMGIHMGEGREDKCRGYTKYIIGLSTTWMVFLSAGLIVGAGILPKLFINDPEVAKLAGILIIPMAIYGLPVAIHQPLAGALRSAGDTMTPLIASMVSLWVCRVFFGWILMNLLDLSILFGVISIAADQAVRATINIVLYQTGRWRRHLQNSSK